MSNRQGSFISNKSNFNKNNTIEGKLTNKMDFFDYIILSQYIFHSKAIMLCYLGNYQMIKK